ncbi:MAG: exo 1,3/1,4-beta-D-glucan glucohydrolase [Hyphomonadaceae bacterium]|nr:exo 1,3/1,4-beta-D-glucan glucohydrolase [Hyphomonadaceae bacterium]
MKSFKSKAGLVASTAVLALLVGCTSTPEPDTGEVVVTEEILMVETEVESPWPDTSIDLIDPAIEAEIDEIIAKMTLEQKVGQVIQGDNSSATPEDVKTYRLGSILSGGNSGPNGQPYADAETWVETVDAYYQASLDTEGVEIAIPIIWGIDAVHGHNNVIGGTIFPHNIGLGAMRNPELIRDIAAATAVELRVTGHDWTFAPTVAVPRNDRWGRTYEGFAEDPEVVASYSGMIVEGLQGAFESDEFMGADKVISTAKHYVGDGGTTDGVDQGDAAISEEDLAQIHGAGYPPAIEAGLLSVMASFNSWNGSKLHGDRHLLTDVLKDRMGFDGFVVGDWNGHGQVAGCTNTDCPQALLAGLDMYMAPDSWKGLYESTLAYVQDGTIPMERLDDAVRRILRAKLRFGLFDQPSPAARSYAGDDAMLGAPEHRAIARQAVRESLVLLKNEGGVLPIDPSLHVLVAGDGADSISKQSGGWTLTWQGAGLENDLFPNGTSILDGIRATASTVTYSESGTYSDKPDVAVVVFGEDPYAEFQGDRDHLAYDAAGTEELELLRQLQADGIPVVSVFLSGRPMWVNREINASDAFVAAWLPGTEGGGVADLLFAGEDGKARHDFTGTLSYSWPGSPLQTPLNIGDEGYDPLFAYGYGLSYAMPASIGLLDEAGADGLMSSEAEKTFFAGGSLLGEWALEASDSVEIARIDHMAQEDALSVVFSGPGEKSVLLSDGRVRDLQRDANGDIELSMMVRSTLNAPLQIGVECEGEGCSAAVTLDPASFADWQEVRISLSCFAMADLTAITSPFVAQTAGAGRLDISDLRLAEDEDGAETCGS